MALELRRKEFRSITVKELVTKLISDRERAGKSDRYIRDLRSRLGRFSTDFGIRSVVSIGRDEITDWIRGLNQSAISQNNYLRVIRILFSEGIKGKYLSESPAVHVTEAKVTQTEVGTLTPGELVILLGKAPEELVPALAIGAFAGIRREEINKLDWRDLDLKHGTIKVRPRNAKSARNRLVPIEANLSDWLKPYARPEGKVWCKGGGQEIHCLASSSWIREAGDGDREGKESWDQVSPAVSREWITALLCDLLACETPGLRSALPSYGALEQSHCIRPLPRSRSCRGGGSLLEHQARAGWECDLN